MDQSCSENDVSMSPSQLLERLQALRQLQLMQRGKLQKQRLQYQESSETSSYLTEIISHFSNSCNSTSYNTFRSLLQSPQLTPDDSPRLDTSEVSPKTSNISPNIRPKDLIEGISMLNLSKESDFIVASPLSSRSTNSNIGQSRTITQSADAPKNLIEKKQISLDEMPILSPRKDFEELVIEKLQTEKTSNKSQNPAQTVSKIGSNIKKPFLKKGEGMARFGLRKNDLVIQKTKSLPWRKKTGSENTIASSIKICKPAKTNKSNDKLDVEIHVNETKLKLSRKMEIKPIKNLAKTETIQAEVHENKHSKEYEEETSTSQIKIPEIKIQRPKGKHPLIANRGKTWAAVLTKEQSDFLSQLKQSDYYKNFASPTKSTVSDISCDDNFAKLRHERELAEQNLFELLENKVTNESFNLENSFFNHFLKKTNLECSGESTPLVMQKCLTTNPKLMHIFPELIRRKKNDSYNDGETVQSEYTDCCSDTCSSVSSCCSCKTVEPATPENCNNIPKTKGGQNTKPKKVSIQPEIDKPCQNDIDETEAMKANMVEMNAKLISTSELLKDRLRELEDEIETFRKENVNLNKLKEDIEAERHKFYEEKKEFEQKFNEEKILSEYYLAEEKEKLNKQKQTYDRYVREMRGRLNKKEKDEVINLKQEVNSLKEEIRIKDAKSTSTIARLRNQIKIMEKEKADLQNEVEKLKKENRRIQHSNDITRRLTNMKYLQEINKKLSNMGKETQSEVKMSSDGKYKAFEIERQSRSRKVQENKNTNRPRAKSVPNLNVTSRYAKYFSQRDTASHFDRNATNVEPFVHAMIGSDDENENVTTNSDDNDSDTENENNLEKIYMETFRSNSPKSNRSSTRNSNNNLDIKDYKTYNNNIEQNGFFLRKSNSSSSRDSQSPGGLSRSSYTLENVNRSKSPVSILSKGFRHKSPTNNDINLSKESELSRSKTPISISTNHSSQSATVIHKDLYKDKLSVSPEPSTSKLTPTEIRKSDGSKELRFQNCNVKYVSADGKYTKFIYYNGDVKENFLNEGRIKYFYAETKTYHTTHADGLEVLEFPE